MEYWSIGKEGNKTPTNTPVLHYSSTPIFQLHYSSTPVLQYSCMPGVLPIHLRQIPVVLLHQMLIVGGHFIFRTRKEFVLQPAGISLRLQG